jgi:hypothetical protein
MATDSDADLQNPDVDARAIVALVAGFLVFAAIAVVGLRFYYMHAHVGHAVGPQEFPEPRLETHNRQDLGVLQKRQRGQLQDYAWRDRERGLVRIPLARAMEIIASRGAGAYDPLEPPAPMAPPATTPTPSQTPPGAPP